MSKFKVGDRVKQLNIEHLETGESPFAFIVKIEDAKIYHQHEDTGKIGCSCESDFILAPKPESCFEPALREEIIYLDE